MDAGTSPGTISRGDTFSRDGTRIAWFRSGAGPSLVLVHGTAADHTTFRAIEPLLREHRTCVAIDRRGRGESDDTLPYSIVREFEDVAAVAEAIARETGHAVDILGHSYGGRCALGAALRTEAIGRLVVYEAAAAEFVVEPLVAELRRLIETGRPDDALRAFLRDVVGQTPTELAAYEASPVWPARVAAAHTIPRELEAAVRAPEATLDALGAVRIPVLLIAGGDSAPRFRDGIAALADRLAHAAVAIIPGQKHAAHHGAPARFVAEVETFLGA